MYKVFIDNTPANFNAPDEAALLREFADHKFVEAAGGIVQYGDKFLFIKRHGLWDIPKGKLDKGESAEIGAVREIEEECGLVKPLIKEHLLNTWHTYEHKGKRVLKKTFWYWLTTTQKNINLVPQEEEGITEVVFFDRSEFPVITASTYASIEDVIRALEKKL